MCRWFLGWSYVSSLQSADESQKGRNNCPLLRSCFLGSCRVGVSKRLSHSFSLAVYCLSLKNSKRERRSEVDSNMPFIWRDGVVKPCLNLIYLSANKLLYHPGYRLQDWQCHVDKPCISCWERKIVSLKLCLDNDLDNLFFVHFSWFLVVGAGYLAVSVWH